MKKVTVTVGIPAYNEEQNISYLIKEILNQKNDNFILKKIIIASDGSFDMTVKKAREIKSNKIYIIDGKIRKGTYYRQNQILRKANTDVLVLLNADITLEGEEFLKEIIEPFYKNQADLVSTRLLALPARNFIEKILSVSHDFKNSVYESIRKGNNVYTCHGAARAFSKNLYKKIEFVNEVGEDAFSYFYAKNHGFKYVYVKKAVCYIRVPNNLKDHKRQSVRFFKSRKVLAERFETQKVNNEYQISKSIMLKKLFVFLLDYPIEIILYVPIVFSMKLMAFFNKNKIGNKWLISKRLR